MHVSLKWNHGHSKIYIVLKGEKTSTDYMGATQDYRRNQNGTATQMFLCENQDGLRILGATLQYSQMTQHKTTRPISEELTELYSIHSSHDIGKMETLWSFFFSVWDEILQSFLCHCSTNLKLQSCLCHRSPRRKSHSAHGMSVRGKWLPSFLQHRS